MTRARLGQARPFGSALISLLVMLVGVGSVRAQAASERAQEPGAVVGEVRDAETGEAVAWVQLLLEEAARSTATDAQGRFRLIDVPAGEYTLKTFRIGYDALSRRIAVPSGDTARVSVRLTTTPVVASEIVVEGVREQAAGAALAVEGQALRQNLGTTIAETLDGEPGIAMRSMGPAPARPVLRGLGGERLLVLEDGGRTGDLSATSSDHALVIEPMSAERIEVIRGPGALQYGPSVLGGVVNVVRGYLPATRPAAAQVGLSLQAASVNRGASGGASATAPLGPLGVAADVSVRRAGDVHTPAGVLQNTALETYSAALGTSWVQRHGYGGVAASYYGSAYGIPGGFVGAHPNGVSIVLDRFHAEARGELYPHREQLPRVEARAQFSRYFHQEFEDPARERLGVEFGVLSYHASLVGHTRGLGPLGEGRFGIWSEWRSDQAGGLSFRPDAREGSVAVFAVQEATLGDLRLEGGVRGDLRRVMPEREVASRRIGRVRARGFGGLSAAAAGTWHPTEPVHLSLTAMRSLRLPGIEELYSEGPHLAAYSFEIGNPELEMERGWGLEAEARYEQPRRRLSVAVFRNTIRDYIFPRNTGEISRVQLPIYQFTGADARLAGLEAQLRWPLVGRLRTEASLSYVRGTLTSTGEPLPFMPPLQSRVGLRYRWGDVGLHAGLRLASPQKRLGAFEEATDGYAVVDLSVQYHRSIGRFLHTFDLGLDNATDAVYRDHLSRVKSIMPEPGRGVRMLYRVYF